MKDYSINSSDGLNQLFNSSTLNELFPSDRTDQFFDALLGDADEGAYDIRLIFQEANMNQLCFAFELKERPGKCLICSLTYGLPHVFTRHPIINVQKIVNDIQEKLKGQATIVDWSLGRTIQMSKSVHIIPLTIRLDHPLAI